jgi:MerR family transcriptional regulator, heat shock protein HspR
MKTRFPTSSVQALQSVDPQPGVLYTLEATAHLAGVSRRAVLVYCKSGLVQPVEQTPSSPLAFGDDAIRAIRQIEYLRSVHGINLTGVRIIFELQRDVERLREEIRFLRGR